MDFSNWKEFRFSRMMVGTVQFGLPYGVANRTGQPEYRDVVRIVAAAIEGGVNCFDTASAYGTSEEVLGRALRELGVADRVTIVTKVRPLTAAESADSSLASLAIQRSVEQSRTSLQIDCLPIVLFHREADAAHRSRLEVLRERGWLKYMGVSCGHCPKSARELAAESSVDGEGSMSAIQAPGSLLDQRHQRADLFQEAHARGLAVFLRSVYLQGLLVMPEEEIPHHLSAVVPIRRQLWSIAKEAGLTLPELAVRYMLSQAGITCVLTGVETTLQVHENLAIFDRGALTDDTIAAIDALAIELPEKIISPYLWPQ